MRNLVQPPLSVRCAFCDGELRFKQTATEGLFTEMDVEIFICSECGREKSYRMGHYRYAARTASNMPPTKMGH